VGKVACFLFAFHLVTGSLVASEHGALVVDDCISARSIVPHEVRLSPNSKQVAYLTKAGNLATNQNEYQLWVRDASPKAPLADGQLLFEAHDLLSGLHWLGDSRRVALQLGGGTFRNDSKILLIDTRSGKRETVVDVPTGIIAENGYAIDMEGDVVAYAAQEEARHPEQDYSMISHGYSVPFGWPLVLYSMKTSTGGAAVVVLKRSNAQRWVRVIDSRLGSATAQDIRNLSMSPDGSYLAFTHYLSEIPESWRHDVLFQFLQAKGMSAYVLGLYNLKTRSLSTGYASPLVTSAVEWAADSRAFAVYAPPPVNSSWEDRDPNHDPSERQVFAVDVRTGSVSHVLRPEMGWNWKENGGVVSWTVSAGQLIVALSGNVFAWMTRSGQEWSEVRRTKIEIKGSSSSLTTENGDLFVGVREETTTPADIFLYDARTGDTALLSNLSPEIRQRTLGNSERIAWTDRNGVTSKGILIKPVRFELGKQYPLVIMTKDWRDSFVCGSTAYATTAFPPQPLANDGFLVLDTADPGGASELTTLNSLAEVEAWVAMIEGAVDFLARSGMADKDNVGIIGFSRTSWYVDFMLEHSELTFKAASSSEGGNYNYGMYWLTQADPEEVGETIYGGPPYGLTLQNWVKSAPAFNAANIRTPLMMEYVGWRVWDQPYEAYEFFTALHRFGKPVDLFFYPNGEHNLDTPFERQASLQRNVDWFRFWMQGVEGKVPKYDPEQYARWRKLREQQEWTDRMRAQGKEPSAEFIRQTSPGAVLGDVPRAPATRQ
jgi:dipeptidyl aminopeptidase/acylaminoacyl peptidase